MVNVASKALLLLWQATQDMPLELNFSLMNRALPSRTKAAWLPVASLVPFGRVTNLASIMDPAHGLAPQGLHGLHGFLAAQGLRAAHGLHGFLAAQGLHGLRPAHGLHGLQGFFAAQGLWATSMIADGLTPGVFSPAAKAGEATATSKLAPKAV